MDEAVPPLTSTQTLVRQAQGGDAGARDELLARCLPQLKRWARGRLPRVARDLADTDDLVQVTLLRTLENLDRLRVAHRGSFLAFVRTVLLNAARDQTRHSIRRKTEPLVEDGIDADPAARDTPGPETLLDYERALATLPTEQRDAVVLRLEFGLTYPEIACELESPSANAARMTVSRALLRLSQEMR